MRLFDVIVAALAVAPLVTAQIDGLAACTQQCYEDLVAKGASLGCPSGEDACLCGNQLFQDGIQDCVSQLCPSQDPSVLFTEEVNKVKTYCGSLVGQSPPADPSPMPTPVPSPEAPSPSPSPPAGTEVPPSVPVESATTLDTESSPSTQDASPSPSPASPVESGQTTRQADPTATSPNSANSSPTADTSASGTGAAKTGAANPDTANTEESNQDKGSGLSTATKITIGAGVGGGALLVILIVAIVMCRRRRKPIGRKISDPLPGSGRYKHQTPPRMPFTFAEKNTSELEMTSRRYEDMLPRQQPRQMV